MHSVMGVINFCSITNEVYIELATGWTIRGSTYSGSTRFFFLHTRPDWPFSRRNLLYNGYRVIPGGKAVEAWR